MDDLINSMKYLDNLIELNLSNNQISSEGIIKDQIDAAIITPAAKPIISF